MSTFYIDPANGNDANSGVDWANAWKTGTSGATLARIAPGDIIKIAKSPDPTAIGNATWTNGSDVVVLASALTAEIVNGGEAWTLVGAGSTAANNVRKIGDYATLLYPGSAFTTGLFAYYTLAAPLDLSGYQQVSFQVYSSVAIAAGAMQIALCSDTAGATPVDTITVPAVPEINKFHTFTVNTAGALGASIQSIAVYFTSDPGTPLIRLGQVIACKASGSADSLTLNSLIGKSADGASFDWYAIRGIIGTSVYIDYNNTLSNELGYYYGSTEAVASYKRECFPMSTTPTVSTQSDFTINDVGTPSSFIQFLGGWDTSTGLQDGLTIVDNLNGEGSGYYVSNKQNVYLQNIGTVRAYYGYYISNSYNIIIENSLLIDCYRGAYLSSYNNITVKQIKTKNCFEGLFVYEVIDAQVQDCYSEGDRSSYNIARTELKGKNLYSMPSLATGPFNAGKIVLRNFNYIYSPALLNFCSIQVTKINADPTLHGQFHIQGEIITQATERHTASGLAWELSANSNSNETFYPLRFKVATALVEAGSLATATVWVKKSHATNTGAKLILPGGQISGAANDVESTKSNDTDWEQLQVQFTPTETGVVELWVYAWYISGDASVYVDDFNITQ